ncbi:hypothetical protein [Labilibaculum sp.]|uniref:hypothetical protein n=1 Tax=Labilibaculum sp. TaxID=2060723 RepID=UPI002AA8B431|nr:hypothetical protein [Labilibaculum sp.]
MNLKDELDNFGQLFKQHLNGTVKATMRWVTPTEIDWEAQTMTATDGDGLEFFDVLLGVGTTAVKPVVDCDCLIAIVEGDEATSILIYADDIEEVYLRSGSTVLTVSTEGCRIERDSEDLLSVLSDLIAEIQKIVVVVGTTPNITALEDVKKRLTKIMN